MSDDARIALALLCLGVAVVAELAGLALVIREARRASRALRRWQDLAPASGQQELREVVRGLLGNSFDRTAAAVLLVTGVVLGGIGGILSL
jgi:hypothetical protein